MSDEQVSLIDKAVEDLGRATRALRAERMREKFTLIPGGKPPPVLIGGRIVDDVRPDQRD